MFKLLRKDGSSERHLPHSYPSGEVAAKAASRLNAIARKAGRNVRYRVIRQKAESSTWKDRELGRFRSDIYKAVPWHREPWAQGSDHFCHVSTDDGSKVAFTESDEKGERDIQTRMRPGKYLERFYGLVLSAHAIRDWAAAYAAENETNDIHFASTPDEIEEVYTSGPNSCMSCKAGDYDSSCHPVRVYGAGDLSVAYLEQDEKITARALVWQEKKVFGRIYGDESRLMPKLLELGYSSRYHDAGPNCSKATFEGARLIRIPADPGFVMPYLDNPTQRVTDSGKFLIINQDGDLLCDSTCGVVGNHLCDHCEEQCHRTAPVGDEQWCGDCIDSDSFCCEDCGYRYRDSDGCRVPHGLVCESCYSDNYHNCAECGHTHANDDFTHTSLDDEDICDRCARRMEEQACGRYAHNVGECECDVCEEARNEKDEQAVEKPPLASQEELEEAVQTRMEGI